jgi:hypothetical protein
MFYNCFIIDINIYICETINTNKKQTIMKAFILISAIFAGIVLINLSAWNLI